MLSAVTNPHSARLTAENADSRRRSARLPSARLMSDASCSRRAVRFRTLSQVDLPRQNRSASGSRILDPPRARASHHPGHGGRASGSKATEGHVPAVNQVVEDPVYEAGGGALDFAESTLLSNWDELVPPSTSSRGRRKRS